MTGVESEVRAWHAMVGVRVVLHAMNDPDMAALDALLANGAKAAAAAGVGPLVDTLWTLRWKALQTILPFNHEQLGLEHCANGLASYERQFSCVRDIQRAVGKLVERVANGKWTVIEEVYAETEHFPMSLWCRPRNSRSPGIPECTANELAELLGRERVTLLGGKRDIPDDGALLLLTSPLHRDFPQACGRALFSHARWGEIHVLAYMSTPEAADRTRELLEHPPGFHYWNGQWCIEERVHGEALPLPRVDEAPDGDRVLASRDRFGDWGEPEPGSTEPIPVVAVGLDGNRKIAYPLDARVFVLNRKPVCEVGVLDLQEDDLIPVLSADDDDQALDEATINRFGGADSYRRRVADCLSWKTTVTTCLNRHGEQRVKDDAFRILGRAEAPWQADAWTSDRILAPKTRAVFRALIVAVHQLGFFRSHGDIEDYISRCWDGIQRLRGTRRAEGRRLNDALRSELRERIDHDPGHEWSETETITLVGGGRAFLVCRVVGEVSRPFLLHPCHTERIKTWQR